MTPQLTGHRNPSVFRRYAIVDEPMLREGAERLSGLLNVQPKRDVLPLREQDGNKKASEAG